MRDARRGLPRSTRRRSASRCSPSTATARPSSCARPDTENHHDLGLFSLGAQAPPPQPGRVGLYHLAWQVDTIHDLAEMRARLLRMGALVGESDHGVSKSLYAKDPDGNEFEVMWQVPREQWGDMEHDAVTQRLDLAAEVARFG